MASGSDEDLQALMKEVELAKAHPHVVQVLGYCKQPPALVSEFMAGGDLQRVLDQPEVLAVLSRQAEDCVPGRNRYWSPTLQQHPA